MRAPRLGGRQTGASGALTPVSEAWIWGRAPDLLLGCGLGYVLLMPPLLWLASQQQLSAWPMFVGVAVTLFVSGPHYGATLLRAYGTSEERRKYALFTVGASLGICLAMVAALHSVWLGSLLLTLYVSWSPWHFAGQNYGLALLFLRRREIEIPPATKRLLYASFVFSTVLAVLPIHSALSRSSYALEVTGEVATYRMLRLGVPVELAAAGVALAAAAYVGCLVGVAVSLRRRARWRELAPAALLVGTQALWFSVPGVVQVTSYSGDALVLTAIWINAAHAAQYLWITSHYARRAESDVRLVPYVAKATLAGSAISFVPALLLAPTLLGTFPYDAGLWALVASVVNLHHFVLDGAIWKLRDGRVARVLLRSTATRAERAPPARALAWLPPAFFAAGALGIAVDLFYTAQRRILAQPDVEVAAARAAMERLAWIGRGSEEAYLGLGALLAERGDDSAALEEYERARQLVPSDPRARHLVAYASLGLSQRAPHPDEIAAHRARAIQLWEQLLSDEPAHHGAARGLARAYVAAGRYQDVLDLLDAAVAAARTDADRAELEQDAETFRDSLAKAGIDPLH